MAQPVLLGYVVRYYTDSTSIEFKYAMWAAIGVCVCSFLNAITYHPYVMECMHIGMRVRVACMTLVYRKALRLSSSAIGKTGVGHLVNLMSNDVNRFEEVKELAPVIID